MADGLTQPGPLRGVVNRLLQVAALYLPGATTTRPLLHRLRGVEIGRKVFIGTDAIIETAYPNLVSIGDEVEIGIRATIIAHFRGTAEIAAEQGGGRGWRSVRIEDQSFIGPGAIVLPNVTIGRGAVVMAGSVVSRSVPPMTMVQGNPAKPVARCGVPLGPSTSIKEFYRSLTPIRRK